MVSLASMTVLVITAVAIAVSVVKNKIKKRRAEQPAPKKLPEATLPAKPVRSKLSKIRRIFPDSGTHKEPEKEKPPEPKKPPQPPKAEEPPKVEPPKTSPPEVSHSEPETAEAASEPYKASGIPPGVSIVGRVDKAGKTRLGDKALVQLTLPFGEMRVEGSTDFAREIVEKVLAKAELGKEVEDRG